jgi:hypothetical protein
MSATVAARLGWLMAGSGTIRSGMLDEPAPSKSLSAAAVLPRRFVELCPAATHRRRWVRGETWRVEICSEAS